MVPKKQEPNAPEVDAAEQEKAMEQKLKHGDNEKLVKDARILLEKTMENHSGTLGDMVLHFQIVASEYEAVRDATALQNASNISEFVTRFQNVTNEGGGITELRDPITMLRVISDLDAEVSAVVRKHLTNRDDGLSIDDLASIRGYQDQYQKGKIVEDMYNAAKTGK